MEWKHSPGVPAYLQGQCRECVYRALPRYDVKSVMRINLLHARIGANPKIDNCSMCLVTKLCNGTSFD